MKSVFLALGLWGAVSASAEAQLGGAEVFPQRITAGELAVACASSALTASGRERRNYCRGFVSGVEEIVRLQPSLGGAEAAPCIPPRTSDRQLAAAYLRHAARREFDRRQPAALAVVEAFAAAFPCRRP
jgi:hypothetical protein